MIFLGTGAAELYPNPFCSCEVCERARREGMRPKGRSSLLIDDENLFDFGPEVPSASQRFNCSLGALKNVFITHTHTDHFCLGTLSILTMTPRRRDNPIHFYLSKEGLGYLRLRLKRAGSFASGCEMLLRDNYVQFHEVVPYEWFDVDEMSVFAVKTNHVGSVKEERSLNYMIKREGGSILYALDTGLWSDENLLSLRNVRADYLVMEGTNGSIDVPRDAGHLNAEHFCENVSNMADFGIIDEDTRIYVTHINQVNSFTDSEYQKYLDENCVLKATVAYDGLNI